MKQTLSEGQELRQVSEDKLVRVDLVNLGEGLSGDYNPEDPDDINLLRFDVYYRKHKHGKWETPDDSSCCTQLPADAPIDALRCALDLLVESVHDPLVAGRSIKKLCESLSWISIRNFSA